MQLHVCISSLPNKSNTKVFSFWVWGSISRRLLKFNHGPLLSDTQRLSPSFLVCDTIRVKGLLAG